MPNRRRSRNLIINKRFQLTLTANILLLQFFGSLALSIILVWLFLYSSRSLPAPPHAGPLLFLFGLLIVAANVLVTVWILRYTHAIAGPILKTTHFLTAAGNGDLPDTTLAFRKDDLFKRMGQGANGCVARLKAQAETHEKLHRNLTDLREKIRTDQPKSEVLSTMETLLATLDTSQKVVS